MDDGDYMRLALALAREGTALASPNPLVGAVLAQPGARGDGIVGRGAHRYAERRHAEIVALAEAGERARGATLYLNLEPCCHTGRTPPCVDAVIAAGVKRVVVAMDDPNPQVAGGGIARLRAAGIEVGQGVMEAEARRLNADFAQWIRRRLPLVTLKAAVSLDGKIAAAASGSASTTYISGEASRARVQRIRHAHDAIMVGIGTVLADNPRLTDRSGLPRRRPLLRAIVDSELRLPLDSCLVQSARDDLIVFYARDAAQRRAALEAAGVRTVAAPAAEGPGVDLDAALRHLGREQILSLLLEGGARLNGTMLAAGRIDRLLLFYAPVLLGDDGVPLARGFTGRLPPPRFGSAEMIAGDAFVEMDLSDPYR